MNHDPEVANPAADSSCRFLFEQADIRGELVQLDASLRDIFAVHQYAPGVQRLLGEFLAAATLLSTTLKFEGRLILQARSGGQVPLLMAECSSDLQIRGIARGRSWQPPRTSTNCWRTAPLPSPLSRARARVTRA